MNLYERAKAVGEEFFEIYQLSYAQLSWDVHPGVAGVLNFDVTAFPAKCGLALKIAFDAYSDVLRAVAHELQIDKAVTQLSKKIDFAMALPFTDSHEQAEKLRYELLC